MLTQAQLRSLVWYNPLTGIFTCINGNLNSPYKNYKGYILLKIKGRSYRAHRLAFLYMTGEWPKGQVDHKDNVKSNNTWLNLRDANNQLNHYNLLKPKNNTSGAKGVRQIKTGKFQARIKHNQKEIYLGIYDTLELASAAYFKKSKELAKEFANQG